MKEFLFLKEPLDIISHEILTRQNEGTGSERMLAELAVSLAGNDTKTKKKDIQIAITTAHRNLEADSKNAFYHAMISSFYFLTIPQPKFPLWYIAKNRSRRKWPLYMAKVSILWGKALRYALNAHILSPYNPNYAHLLINTLRKRFELSVIYKSQKHTENLVRTLLPHIERADRVSSKWKDYLLDISKFNTYRLEKDSEYLLFPEGIEQLSGFPRKTPRGGSLEKRTIIAKLREKPIYPFPPYNVFRTLVLLSDSSINIDGLSDRLKDDTERRFREFNTPTAQVIKEKMISALGRRN